MQGAEKMKRIMLWVAYDGTNYHGWQIQPGVDTIEGELNKALTQLMKEEIQVTGASRTDTGVHALGNLAVFDTGTNIPPKKVSYALNALLPEDIRIQQSCLVEGDFHPRKTATRKTYRYQIQTGEFPNPLLQRYVHFTYHSLDIEKMKEASTYFLGEHDFKSFCAAGSTAETTVRRIYDLQVEKKQELIEIKVTGNGFLYNMVRIIAGTLMEVGRGKIEPKEIKEIIKALDRTKAGPTAVAKGLTLLDYYFEEYPQWNKKR